jgi:hypothetical protein
MLPGESAVLMCNTDPTTFDQLSTTAIPHDAMLDQSHLAVS